MATAVVWMYTIISVLIVSIISLLGIFALSLSKRVLHKILLYLVSFAVGALLGDAFLHILPEMVSATGFTLSISIYILLGVLIFFVLEKIVRWHHCHDINCEINKHPESFATVNLVGDGLHNFIDGLLIGGTFLISIPLGIATTIAVLLHEIPQEIGDFAILLHAGYSKKKALAFNFLSALLAVVGAIVALIASGFIHNLEFGLSALAMGAFIYLAVGDLLPELQKETNITKSLCQLVFLVLGIGVMFLLLSLG